MERSRPDHEKHRHSLRLKVMATVIVGYAGLMFSFIYLNIVADHHHIEEELINQGHDKAKLIAAAVAEKTFSKDQSFLSNFAKQSLMNSDIEYLQIRDNRGNVMAQAGRLARFSKQGLHDPPPAEVLSGPMDQEIGKSEGILHKSGHLFDIYYPVIFEGRHVGSLHLGVNTIAGNQFLARVMYRWMAITIVIMFVGILLTYLIFRQMRKALRKLIKAMAYVAQGDMTQSVSLQTRDELEELSRSFNRMRQALIQREKELIIARNTMDSMFNGITAGIAYVSKDYQIVHANRAYGAFIVRKTDNPWTDYKCYEIFGKTQAACIDCPGTSAMKTGRPHNLEKEVKLNDGRQHVLWVHAYPVLDSNEAPAGFVEYILDITEQRKMQNELKQYAERLEEMVEERTQRLKEAQAQILHREKMAALGQMAAGVAHEIGNPLSSISSVVAGFQDHLKSKQSGEQGLLLIQEQIHRISRIVQQMTAFARPASYRKSLTHVNEVVRSALGISHYDKRLDEVHVITSLDREIPALKLDGDQLLQVFLNIILNAGHAMKGKGTLTVTSSSENGYVTVSFEDTGPGISEEARSQIFEPFFTTKDVGEGTGLGLSVSYGIMQSMGGEIEVANRKEGGCVFTVEIPIKDEVRRGRK